MHPLMSQRFQKLTNASRTRASTATASIKRTATSVNVMLATRARTARQVRRHHNVLHRRRCSVAVFKVATSLTLWCKRLNVALWRIHYVTATYIYMYVRNLAFVSDIDECLNKPCKHGDCRNVEGGYVCDCHEGYEGDFCDVGMCILNSRYVYIECAGAFVKT